MRLVCPNCEAKYEVPEDAIPETGRDVQCANCGHAWFQMRPRPPAAETAPVAPPPLPEPRAAESPAVDVPAAEPSAVVVETAAAEPPPLPPQEPAPVAEPAIEPVSPVERVSEPVAEHALQEIAGETPIDGPEALATPAAASDDIEPAVPDAPADEAAVAPAGEPAAETVAHPSPKPVPEGPAEPVTPVPDAEPAAEDRDDAMPEAPAAAVAAAYAVDESVLAILREEAEREAKARQAEAAKPLETQTDLGIDQAMPMAARLRDPAAEDPSLPARRARLPDVEEINSTLRPSESIDDDGPVAAMPVEVEGRSSFRSGFLLVLTVAILGSAVYGSADMLAELIPALAGPLKSYVSFVDSLRLQLDGLMQSATLAINGS